MNHQIKRFYTCSIDNEILIIDTNLSSFWRRVTGQSKKDGTGTHKSVKGFQNYRAATWVVTKFKQANKSNEGRFTIDLNDNTYHFQEIKVE